MDIEKIRGPGGADPNKETGKKDKAKGNEFKEFMKVDAVNETDPELLRKRKQRAEDVEDGEDHSVQEETNPEDVPKFSLQEADSGEAGPASAQNAKEAPPLTKSMGSLENVREPSSASSQEKLSAREIDLSASELPSAKSKSPVQDPKKKSDPKPSEPITEKPQPKKVEAEQNSPRPIAENVPTNPKEHEEVASILLPPEENLIEKLREAEKKGTLPIEPPPVLNEESEGYFTQMRTEAIDQKEEVNLEGAISQNISINPAHEAVEEEKGVTSLNETTPTAREAPLPTPTPLPAPSETNSPPPVYTHLSSQTLALFERMVGVITVMQTTGLNETTLHLSAEQFSSSVFFGAKIIISEDKNARNQFNIEIQASPQATVVLNQNLPLLVTAFEKGGYNFEVKQIRVSLTEETEGEFRRKSKVGDEGSENEQGQQ